MRKILLIGVVLAACVVGWLWWRQGRNEPLVVSGFVEADQIRAGSRVGGRVAEVLVSEGNRLKPGDVLFRLEPYDLNERLARAEAELAVAKAELARLTSGFRVEEVREARAQRDRAAATLAKLQAGPRPLEIRIAEQQLKAAQANLDLAATEQRRLASMAREDTASQIEAERADRALKVAQAEAQVAEQELMLLREGTRAEEIAEAQAALAEAQAALDLREEGYRIEEIAQAEARLSAAEAEVKLVKSQIAELVVRSPGDLTIEAIDLHPGDIVPANAPAVSLLDTSSLWIRTYIPESQLGVASVGHRVPVRIDSFPDRRFYGTITFISPDAEFTPRNVQTVEERSKLVFRTKITLDPEHADELRVGMMGDVLLGEASKP